MGHSPIEFKLLAEIVDLGLTDLFRKFTPGPGHYTYWDYIILTSVPKNFGWRIDHILATDVMAARCRYFERAARATSGCQEGKWPWPGSSPA